MRFTITREKGFWRLSVGGQHSDHRELIDAVNRAVELGASGGWTKDDTGAFVDNTQEVTRG